jgi:hypothetical protein
MSLKIVKPSRIVVTVAFVLAATIASYGQSIVPGNFEVTSNLGIVSGIGSHGSFGGSVGAPISDHLILSGDLSYIPMGGANVTVGQAQSSSSAKAFNFNGNVQYQFKALRATVPYLGGGLGFLHSSFSTSSNISGTPLNVSGTSTDMYFNVGGGLRYYVRERWGFRPELMTFAGTKTYVRFAGGIFYKFGE